jgi:hypothetical protein
MECLWCCVLCWDHRKCYQRSNWGVECPIFWVDSGGCHGDCISAILLIGSCKDVLSSSFRGLARILQFVTIWTI